jgi:hypothetical protein
MFHINITSYLFAGEYVVAQMVEALRYKLEDGRFDSRYGLWDFSSTQFFRPHYDPGVVSASIRNE